MNLNAIIDVNTDAKRQRDSDGDETMSDEALSEMSDKSAYSIAQAKRPKLEDPVPLKAAAVLKPAVPLDETSKRRAAVKTKGR